MVCPLFLISPNFTKFHQLTSKVSINKSPKVSDQQPNMPMSCWNSQSKPNTTLRYLPLATLFIMFQPAGEDKHSSSLCRVVSEGKHNIINNSFSFVIHAFVFAHVGFDIELSFFFNFVDLPASSPERIDFSFLFTSLSVCDKRKREARGGEKTQKTKLTMKTFTLMDKKSLEMCFRSCVWGREKSQ